MNDAHSGIAANNIDERKPAPAPEESLLATIEHSGNVDAANLALSAHTDDTAFFQSAEEMEQCRAALWARLRTPARMRDRQWGDVQTPLELALEICSLLRRSGAAPDVVIDPTCGDGAMLSAAVETFGGTLRRLYGVEIQPDRYWTARARLDPRIAHPGHPGVAVDLRCDDVFTHRFEDDLSSASELLILGNPPWVTTAVLGSLASSNIPKKHSDASFVGFEALTGRSNFDIGEVVLARALDLFSGRRGTLAMLCKRSVARKIIQRLYRGTWACSDVRLYTIDAARHFHASVDACLLVARLGARGDVSVVPTAALDAPEHVVHRFGWSGDRFVADLDRYTQVAEFDGAMPIEWRQGIKHDCARVMELTIVDGSLHNGNGDVVDVESEWLYPLAKSGDLGAFQLVPDRRRIVITQHLIGAPTSGIEHDAPRLWRYLEDHRDLFQRRRSSIYRTAPDFAIFGVGIYSFKPYKVAVSGLHKEPWFTLLLPEGDRPAMLDDTCYFIGFDHYTDALFTVTLLRHRNSRELLRAIAFTDAKRPYTKSLLMRIDLAAIARNVEWAVIEGIWKSCGFTPRLDVSESQYAEYRERIAAEAAAGH